MSALLPRATDVNKGAGLLLLLSLAGIAPVNTMPKVPGWLETTF